jgi:hypothetical protein
VARPSGETQSEFILSHFPCDPGELNDGSQPHPSRHNINKGKPVTAGPHGRLSAFSHGQWRPGHEPGSHRSRRSLTRAPVPCQTTIPPGPHSIQTVSGPGETTPGIVAPDAATARNPRRKAQLPISHVVGGEPRVSPETANGLPTTPDDRPNATTLTRRRHPPGAAGPRHHASHPHPAHLRQKPRSTGSSFGPSRFSRPTAARQAASGH